MSLQIRFRGRPRHQPGVRIDERQVLPLLGREWWRWRWGAHERNTCLRGSTVRCGAYSLINVIIAQSPQHRFEGSSPALLRGSDAGQEAAPAAAPEIPFVGSISDTREAVLRS
jgi:hypothetical protein